MKWLSVGCAVALVTVAWGASTLALASDSSVSQFCKDNADFGLTHAECVTIFSNGNAIPHLVEQCIKPRVREGDTASIPEECVELIRELVQ